MKVNILDTDKLISVNNLKEITSPRLFSNKMLYDPDGILSSDIFGISKDDRRTTFAYIDLGRYFIHPHVYSKVLKQMYKNIIYLVSGQKYFLVKNGLLIEDDNGWTGIDSLYEHWDEINWNKMPSSNKTSKSLMNNLSKDQIFINKFIIIPPAYRDVILSGTIDQSDHVSPLNDLYVKLIRMVALLKEGGLLAFTQYGTQFKIQELLVDIMVYFKNQISRKQGLIRKYLIGKSVDYGVRAVISAPSYNHEHFSDNMVTSEQSAVPISMFCSLFYPFVHSWVQNFFTREIINDPKIFSFYDYSQKKEISATVHDPEMQFGDRIVDKIINDYCLNPDNRFKILNIDIDVNIGNKTEIHKGNLILKGKILLENNATTILNRPMTVTDLLYLACVDCAKNKHIMTSRYPVGTDKGIFFSKPNIQSTKEHIHLIFNGEEYPYYPKINFNIPSDQIGVQFIDAFVMSNSHLDGMGAD